MMINQLRMKVAIVSFIIIVVVSIINLQNLSSRRKKLTSSRSWKCLPPDNYDVWMKVAMPKGTKHAEALVHFKAKWQVQILSH